MGCDSWGFVSSVYRNYEEEILSFDEALEFVRLKTIEDGEDPDFDESLLGEIIDTYRYKDFTNTFVIKDTYKITSVVFYKGTLLKETYFEVPGPYSVCDSYFESMPICDDMTLVSYCR